MGSILVLSEDVDVRHLLAAVVEEASHHVVMVEHGEEALATLRRMSEATVVLLSHSLGDTGDMLSSFQAIVHDHELAPRHAFVVLSNSPQQLPPTLLSALDVLGGVTLWIPFDMSDVLDAITTAAKRLDHWS